MAEFIMKDMVRYRQLEEQFYIDSAALSTEDLGHEGKNRQIRRMFAAVGINVQELERIQVGNIKLGHLKPGQYRRLTEGEIEYLKTL